MIIWNQPDISKYELQGSYIIINYCKSFTKFKCNVCILGTVCIFQSKVTQYKISILHLANCGLPAIEKSRPFVHS